MQLLDRDKKKRLGQVKDSEEVLSHPFFKDIDTDKLLKKELEAPYIPTIEPINPNGEVTESLFTEEKIKAIEAKKDDFESFGL